MIEIWNKVLSWLETTGLDIASLLIIGLVITFVLRTLVRPRFFFYRKTKDALRHAEQQKRAQTLVAVVRGTGNVILWMLLVALIIRRIGVNLGPLIASAGIAGIAVGFGAQSLVKDMIAGFFVLFENHYNIGDVITVAGVTGRVEEINLRTTVLRDLEGAVHIIPNGQIRVVTNKTKQWSQVVLDTAIAHDEDIDRAMTVIKQVGEEMLSDKRIKSAILASPKILGVNEISKNQVIIRSLIKTKPEKRWAVERVMRKKIVQAFDKEGIRQV